MLAAASPWRPRIAPRPPTPEPATPEPPKCAGGYRPWAELLARTFAVDVLACPAGQGRLRLLAMIKEPASIARYLAAVGEATEVPLSPVADRVMRHTDGARVDLEIVRILSQAVRENAVFTQAIADTLQARSELAWIEAANPAARGIAPADLPSTGASTTATSTIA